MKTERKCPRVESRSVSVQRAEIFLRHGNTTTRTPRFLICSKVIPGECTPRDNIPGQEEIARCNDERFYAPGFFVSSLLL